MAEFLFEVFSEEIPARMQLSAALRWKLLAEKLLQEQGLAFERIETFVTPRRLTLLVEGLPLEQPARQEVRKGPRVDAPAQAVEGFFRSVGQGPEACTQEAFGKQICWVASLTFPGRATVELIPSLCQEMLTTFSWPKSMRWGMSTCTWIRPIQNLLCIFDGKPVPWTFDPDGEPLVANGRTYGHRFLKPDPFNVSDFQTYRDGLENAFVVLDVAERRRRILKGLQRLATNNHASLLPEDLEDGGLIDEVVGLVEWPVVFQGNIQASFLKLPPEVLITPMRAHQRYFAFQDPSTGRLAPCFGIVANRPTKDDGEKLVEGNERVLSARLADAHFFWNQDLKQPLSFYQELLKTRQFFNGLGTLYDKSVRLEKLAAFLGSIITSPTKGRDDDVFALQKAARLCKADLTTHMVGEFPELQGTMGMYYALEQGIEPDIAKAFQEHYWPQGNAAIPPGMSSLAMQLGVLDRLDTLVGFFKINQIPTGSKDPLALRRAASGLLQLLLALTDDIPLSQLIAEAYALYPAQPEHLPLSKVMEKIALFLGDRLRHLLKERQIPHDCIEAVLKTQGNLLDNLKLYYEKAEFLTALLKTPSGAAMAEALKRAFSILQAEEAKHHTLYADTVQEEALVEPAERALWTAVKQVEASTISSAAWKVKLENLQHLTAPIQTFFEQLIVNAPEATIRLNRLALLVTIRNLTQSLADFIHLGGSVE